MAWHLIQLYIALGIATISCWDGSTPKGKPRPGVGQGDVWITISAKARRSGFGMNSWCR